MTQRIDVHALVHQPAHRLVEQTYLVILQRPPAFDEQVYHLSRLFGGCSRKLFVLSVLYSPEGQAKAGAEPVGGGRLFRLFHRIVGGRPWRAKLLIKLMHYADVLSGRARLFAHRFQVEWQLSIFEHALKMYTEGRKTGAEMEAMRSEIRMQQQDIQRRIDLFLLDAMQVISAPTLTAEEKMAWRRRLEEASGALHS